MKECHLCNKPISAKGLCNSHYVLKWQKENKDKANAKSRRWAQKNREYRTEYFKKYRATKKGKEATLKAIKKYEFNHPERKNAWNKAQQLKNEPCIKCGMKAHKHHPDINKPLEVIMLCPLHHKQQHVL